MGSLVIKKEGGIVVKRIAGLLGALALVFTGVASMGCVIFFMDEPTAPKNLVD